jgi:hypothetical protein
LIEGARDFDVVVLDERDAMAHRGVACELHDLADHVLAGVVGRVRLAGEHQLQRTIGRQQQRTQAFRL